MEKTLPWVSGYGTGLTGPTTANPAGPVCGERNWPFWPISKGKETIAIVVGQRGEDSVAAKDRAAFIVRACNAHDELLAACERAAELLIEDEYPVENGSTVQVLRTAIAAARGE